jgi:hypothetical protein
MEIPISYSNAQRDRLALSLAQFVLRFELCQCYLPQQQFFGIVRYTADQ